jgi:type IV pilus assembly protein PilB
MPISAEIERMIISQGSSAEIKKQAVVEGMLTLRSSALEKLKRGITTVSEVLAVTTTR